MAILNAGSSGAGVFLGPRRLSGPYTFRWVMSSTAAVPWFQPVVPETVAQF